MTRALQFLLKCSLCPLFVANRNAFNHRAIVADKMGAGRMNGRQRIICLCGVVLCLCFFWFVVPVVSSDGHSEYVLNEGVIGVLLVGWCLIITICIFVAKLIGKKKDSK
jgi:hypothetical protein